MRVYQNKAFIISNTLRWYFLSNPMNYFLCDYDMHKCMYIYIYTYINLVCEPILFTILFFWTNSLLLLFNQNLFSLFYLILLSWLLLKFGDMGCTFVPKILKTNKTFLILFLKYLKFEKFHILSKLNFFIVFHHLEKFFGYIAKG